MTLENRNNAEAILDEAESLIWALLDEQIDDVDTAKLSQLLEQDALVRERYLECVQLHVDLMEHFGQKAVSQKQDGAIMPDLFANPPGFPEVPGVAH